MNARVFAARARSVFVENSSRFREHDLVRRLQPTFSATRDLIRRSMPAGGRKDGADDGSQRVGFWSWLALFGLTLGAAACAVLVHVSLRWPEMVVRYRLDRLAPAAALALLALCAAGAIGIGYSRQRRTGRSFFLPVSTLFLSLTILLATVCLIGWWTVDLSGWELPAIWVAVLGLIALALPHLLLVGTECWRTFFNRAVCAELLQAFAARTFRTARDGSRRDWGSPHALRQVQALWDWERHGIIQELCRRELNPTAVRAAMTSCARAGDALVLYLRRDWPEDLLPPDEAAHRRAEVLRQLLTLGIGVARLAGSDKPGQRVTGAARLPDSTEPSQLVAWLDEFKAASEAWTQDFKTAAEAAVPGPFHVTHEEAKQYADAMGVLFDWTVKLQVPDAAQAIRRSSQLFDDLAPSFAEIFAWSWLGMMPFGDRCDDPTQFGPTDLLHTWERFAGRLEGGISLFPRDSMVARSTAGVPLPLRSAPCDAAAALASTRLPALYRNWELSQPVAVSRHMTSREAASASRADGFAARVAARRTERRDGAPVILAEARSDGRSIHSWPYREVYGTRDVRRAFVLAILIIALGLIGLLNAVAPRMPFNWGWNVLDHVEDRSFGNSAPRGAVRALARSGNYLGVGTDEGLFLMHEASRTQFGRQFDRPVRDLAAGFAADGLLVLDENGELTEVNKEDPGFSKQTWLPASPQPVWRGIEKGVVRAAGLADGRCVLVMSGKSGGIGAYGMPAGVGWHGAWETGDYANANIANAWMAGDRAYLEIEKRIRCVDRASLHKMGSLEFNDLQTLGGAIDHFVFGARDHWAALVEDGGALWLQPSSGGWTGTFFGAKSNLQNASAVIFARIESGIAWLATADALHVYDLDRRTLRTVFTRGPLTKVFPIEGEKKALVGGRQGLFVVDATGGESRQLETRPVLELAVGPGGQACIYRLGPDKDEPRESVRTSSAPFTSTQQVLSEKGWHGFPGNAAPAMTGLAEWNGKTVFTNLNGAFIYDPAAHTYEDASTVARVTLNQGQVNDTVVDGFRFTGTVSGAEVLSLIDGSPAVLRPRQGAHPAAWFSLDPRKQTHPAALASAGGSFFGIGSDGPLWLYTTDGLRTKTQPFCAGDSAALQNAPDSRSFLGDLLPVKVQAPPAGDTPESAAFGFVIGNRVVTYDAGSATLQESSPGAEATRDLKQYLLHSQGQHFFLRGDQRVVSARGSSDPLHIETFGAGAMPFTPPAITAVGELSEEMLVAGANHVVAAYSWPTGGWRTLTAGPCPLAPGDVLTTVQGNTAGFVFVNTRDGRPHIAISRSGGSVWQALNGSRVAATIGPDAFFLLSPSGIQRIEPTGQPMAEWSRRDYSIGTGARAFIESASAVWQPAEGRTVFLHADGRAGTYESATDTWSEAPLPEAGAAGVSYVPVGDALFALGGRRLLRYSEDLKLTSDTELKLPPGGVLARQGATLRAAAAVANEKGILLWPGETDSSGGPVLHRGAEPLQERFDPANSVFASAATGGIFLVDEGGACFHYAPATGDWRQVRPRSQGERLRQTVEASGYLELRLSGNGGGTRIVRIDLAGAVQSDETIPTPIEQLAAHLAAGLKSTTQAAARARAEDTTLRARLEKLAAEKAALDIEIPRCRGYEKSLQSRIAQPDPAGVAAVGAAGVRVYLAALDGEAQRMETATVATTAALPAAEARAKSAEAEAARAGRQSTAYAAPGKPLGARDPLLANANVTVSRKNGRTSFRFGTDAGVEFALHPTESGFAEDAAHMVTLDGAGSLWAATSTGLVRFEPGTLFQSEGLVPTLVIPLAGIRSLDRTPDGFLRVGREAGVEFFSTTGSRLARVPHPAAASEKLGAHTLDWYARDVTGFVGRWRDGATTPVWGSRGGKFSWQCITDFALAQSDQLVLATEGGLVVRDVGFDFDRYVLTAFHPADAPARLIAVPGPNRVVAVQGTQRLLFGEKERPEPAVLAAAEVAGEFKNGPWRWHVTIGLNANVPHPALNITLGDTGPARAWRLGADGKARFADDCVNWLLRRGQDHSLWLATDWGLWPYDPVSDRGETALLPATHISMAASPLGQLECWMDAAGHWRTVPWDGKPSVPVPSRGRDGREGGPEGRFKNPAIEVVQSAGNIRFKALDTPAPLPPKPVFRDKRFYFDAQTGLATDGVTLWTLVPGRCLIGRSPANPASITVCIPLKSPLPANASFVLEQSPTGPRLRENRSNANAAGWWVSWDEHGNVRWKERPPDTPPPNLIVWRPVPAQPATSQPGLIEPMTTTNGELQPIPDWWSGDRFTWDHATAVGLLDHDRPVILSAAGPSLLAKTPAGFPVSAFWARQNLTTATAAHRGGEPAGVALRAGTGPALLLAPTRDGVQLTAAEPPPLEYSRLVWKPRAASEDPAIPFAHIALAQEWHRCAWDGAPGGVLDSAIVGLPASDLLQAGTFVFDGARAVCEMPGTSSPWLTATPRGAHAQLTLNALQPIAGRTRLILLATWPIPTPVRELRPADGGRTLLAFYGENGAPRFARAVWSGAQPVWEPGGLAEAAPAFQTGQSVHLDLSRMAWSTRPRYPWDAPAPGEPALLANHPDLHEFPLFTPRDGGLEFSFDDWRSIAARDLGDGAREIAVATAAGVWVGPFLSNPAATFSHASGGFFCGKKALLDGLAETIDPLDRIRYLRDAGPGSVERLVVTLPGKTHLELAPADSQGRRIFQPVGAQPATGRVWISDRGQLVVDGLPRLHSTDAWRPHRVPLSDIVDILPGHRSDEYWVATELNGLVKVTLP